MKSKSRNRLIHKIAFLKNIKENSADLSGKQVKIADYILRHYDKAAFMTAARLASEVGVSESTVIRFAISLGYKGYPEFQGYLQKIIVEQLTSTERLELSIHSEAKDDLLSQTFLKEANNIKEAYKNVSPDDFRSMVDLILESKKIFVTGIRASTCLAQYFAFQLGRIRENALGITFGGRESWDLIRGGGAEDLLIAIAFPRYPRETIELVDFALHLKMRVAGITDRMASPIARRCRPTLLVPFELVTFVDLYSAPLTIMAALTAEVAIRAESKSFACLERFEDFVKQSKIFYKMN
jgi:DNA-binding MurR/RpiR family transcriptional regulator